ncbi:hypothetical protein ACRCUN_00195 [Mycobacterium sp. LTG2003]
MDVVLGVAVTGRVARLAMIGSPASGGQLLDQYALDLSDDGMSELAETIIGTFREVTESGNQVAATRLCLPDASEADTLRQTVLSAGVPNIEVVAEAEAAAALARSAGADAALLLSNDDTASLTMVGENDEATSILATVPVGAAGAAAACAAALQQVPATDAPMRVMLVGQRLDLDSVAAELRSTAPVEVPADAGYAIARGAAQAADGFAPAGAATQMAPAVDATQLAPAAVATQMAPAAAAAADATQMAPASEAATEGAVGPDLAYSQETESEPWPDEMPMDPLNEFVPEQADEAEYTTAIAPPPPRMLLMGSAVMFVVVSFATLAVTVVTNVRPAADVSAQPVTATQANTVPGNYLPPVPHEPDPVALPVAVLTPPPAAPAAPSVRSGTGDRPANQAPRVQAPAPAAPPAAPAPPPVQAPAPVPVPVPVPPVIVLPPLTPWTPPWVTPTTPTTPPTWTTPTTPPTTPPTTTPPTTPPTTTKPPTSTTAPPTTSTTVEPTTTAPQSPPSSEPSAPVVEEPSYTPPPPVYTPPVEQPVQQAPEVPASPVYPEVPSGGGSSGGGEDSSGGDSGGGGDYGDSPVTTVPLSP